LSEKKVYARTASGLIRTYSWIDILIFNLLFECAAVVAPFNYQEAAYAYPSADVATATLFWTVFALAFGGMLVFLTAIFPRSGGDYMINSRTLNPGAGFVISWITVIAAFGGYWVGVFANLVTSFALPDILYSIGVKYNQAWAIAIVPRITTPYFEIGVGIIALLTWVIVITFLRPDQFSKVMLGFAIFGVIGLLVNAIVLYATPASSFPGLFNKFAVGIAGPNYTNYYTTLINQAGFQHLTYNYGLPFLLTGPVLIWLAMWYAIGSSFITGEVRNVKRSQTLGIMLAIAINGLLGYILLAPMYGVQGLPFSAAIDQAYTNFAYALYPLVPMPLTTGVIVSPNIILDGIMVISFIGWILLFIPVVMIGMSRSILAWSFDRVIPDKFSEVDPKYHQPPYAILLSFVIAFASLIIYSFSPLLFTTAWTTVFAGVVYLSLGVSSIIVPFKKKDWYDTAGIAKYRIGGVPLLSICGAITIGLSLFVILGFLVFPGYSWAGGGLPAISLYAATIFSGLAIYIISRVYRSRVSKINADLAFKELAPE
jgi:basic amino acid/polyamine antiporter, APA family